MGSSTFSSEEVVHGSHSLPSGLRLTAADRPNMAQPVPERDVPQQPWGAITLTVAILLLLFTSLWEWKMRSIELVPGDVGSSLENWAELRRGVDNRNVPVVILGDSRILFDSDLDRAMKLTGIRPLQLALIGSSGLPVLEDLADDSHFHGLVILGIAETAYFDLQFTGKRPQDAVTLYHSESLSKRVSFLIQRRLIRSLAMLDQDYQLSTIVFRNFNYFKPSVFDPTLAIWKAQETNPSDGQARLWSRLEHDKDLSERMRNAWFTFYPSVPEDDQTIHSVEARTKSAIDKIRARGGDVVFVRSPSSPDLRAIEDKHLPRSRGWNALLAYTHSKGVHIDDLPAVQNLTLPEHSHLTHRCATVFTDAYIRGLAGKTSLLPLLPDAPRPLSTGDCVSSPSGTEH